eukprot:2374402-Rhodomonas_salina.5
MRPAIGTAPKPRVRLAISTAPKPRRDNVTHSLRLAPPPGGCESRPAHWQRRNLAVATLSRSQARCNLPHMLVTSCSLSTDIRICWVLLSAVFASVRCLRSLRLECGLDPRADRNRQCSLPITVGVCDPAGSSLFACPLRATLASGVLRSWVAATSSHGACADWPLLAGPGEGCCPWHSQLKPLPSLHTTEPPHDRHAPMLRSHWQNSTLAHSDIQGLLANHGRQRSQIIGAVLHRHACLGDRSSSATAPLLPPPASCFPFAPRFHHCELIPLLPSGASRNRRCPWHGDDPDACQRFRFLTYAGGSGNLKGTREEVRRTRERRENVSGSHG